MSPYSRVVEGGASSDASSEQILCDVDKLGPGCKLLA